MCIMCMCMYVICYPCIPYSLSGTDTIHNPALDTATQLRHTCMSSVF